MTHPSHSETYLKMLLVVLFWQSRIFFKIVFNSSTIESLHFEYRNNSTDQLVPKILVDFEETEVILYLKIIFIPGWRLVHEKKTFVLDTLVSLEYFTTHHLLLKLCSLVNHLKQVSWSRLMSKPIILSSNSRDSFLNVNQGRFFNKY